MIERGAVVAPPLIRAPVPTPTEIATLVVLGQVSPRLQAPDPDARASAGDVWAAFERAVRPALRRPPCVVSFSGGMDSSFVLAIAARLARREGLPAPIPVTWRFIDAPRAEESAAQDRAVAVLGLAEWTILRAADDLDFVGPVAARVLRRHGVLLPPNLHLHEPIVELGAGGSLLTGIGGDQVLTGMHRARRRWPPPRPRTVARQVLAAVRRRRAPSLFPWLLPDTRDQLDRDWWAEQQAEPRAADARIRWHAGRRDMVLTGAGLATIAADHDTLAVSPFLDPGFLAALAAWRGRRSLPSRADLLAGIAGDAVPAVITTHRRKAGFNEVFLRAPTREFVAGWDGTGVDETVVDVAALKTAWSRWPIPLLTAGLVQQAWLATAAPAPATTSSGGLV